MNALLVVLATLASSLSQAADSAPCSIAKVQSTGIIETDGNQAVQVEGLGNAFAVRKDLLLSNFHTVAPGATIVNLSVKYEKGDALGARGVVIAKDFHTDLALIRLVDGGELIPCSFSPTRPEVGLKPTIFGFRKENRHITPSYPTLQENLSGNLAIPGYDEALELQLGFPAESLSGSPIFSDNRVIGVVNAQSGTLILAPSGRDVQQAFEELLKSYLSSPSRTGVYEIPRNYLYNDRKRTIEFAGLEIREGDQSPILLAEGTPHFTGPEPEVVIAEGTPHRDNRSGLYGPTYDNTPVASMTTDLGYVVAHVTQGGLEKLRVNNPTLAQRISDATATKIAILQIDGQATKNLLELLRHLAKAQPAYAISAALPTLTPAAGEKSNGSPYEQSIRDANNLMNSLSSALEDASLAFELRERMSQFITLLGKLDRQWALNKQSVDSRLVDEAREAWAAMDGASRDGALFRATAAHTLTPDERHWRDGIRTRPPML